MPKNSFQKGISDSESQIKYLESLSPEERRAFVIKERDAQNRSDGILVTFAAFLGLLWSALISYVWLYDYKMSLMSSFGIIGGMIVNFLGYQYVKFNRIKSISKLQSNDFTDEDVLAYLRERRKSNQKDLDSWGTKRKYYIIAFLGIVFLLYFIPFAREFLVMFMGSMLGIFSIGFVIFSVIERGKYKKT